jgi:hypothetical protein
MKNAVQLFGIQILQYGICCFSYRVLAQGNIPLTVGTDFVYSLLMFTVIRKVVNSQDDWLSRAGYMTGSATGSLIGILLSRLLTGK